MAEIASAFVSILPSAKGFGSKLNSQIGGEVAASGKSTGSKFGSALKVGAVAAIGGAALGAAAFTKTAIGLEAAFSKTMNVLQATTGASSTKMKELSALAIKMGADTAFSASDASQAMLELARGGITPAQIQAGALKGTLTLAAAGEMDMGTAANTAVKAMGAFNLQGKDMNTIAAALAGGANASASSVSDLSQALAQGGLAAHSAGFSIQETTAILAAFSNSGLNGADAGTSLKTMLNSLQPQTEKAADAFQQLGIWSDKTGSAFVKRNGEFKSAAQIAELLHKGTAKLTSAERTQALTTAFGTDAQRAATVLAKQGAAGLLKLEKATSDTSAAQKMGAANMKGTAGALEQLKGSLETVTLQFGLLIAPVIQGGLKMLTNLVNGIVPTIQRLSGVFSGGSGGGLGASLSVVADTLRAKFLPIFQQVWQVIATRVIPIVMGLAKFFYGTLLPAVLRIVAAVATQLRPVFDQLVKTFQTSVLPTVSKLLARFQQWMPTIQKVVVIVLKVVGVLLVFAAAILGKVLPPLIRFAGFMIGRVAGSIGIVIGALARIIGWIIKVGSVVVGGVKAWVTFQVGIVRAVGHVIGIVAGLPGRIASALGNLGSLLFHAGESILQGLIDGIESKISALTSKLHSITSMIPLHKGPLTKDAVLLRPAGQIIMGGLIGGIDSQRPSLRAKLRSVTDDVSMSPGLGLDVSGGLAAVAGAGRSGGRSVILRVGDRDMQAWFEENFDGEMVLR